MPAYAEIQKFVQRRRTGAARSRTLIEQELAAAAGQRACASGLERRDTVLGEPGGEIAVEGHTIDLD